MKLMKTLIASVLVAATCSAFADSLPYTMPSQNIVQIAAGNANFKTLVAAVQAANLVTTLEGAGPFTVFAPTDAAFAKLPAGTVQALLNDIPTLTKILTYHVVAGEQSIRQLAQAADVKTVQGESVRVTVTDCGKLYINDSLVTMKPIQASNGVIYVIDSVLMPK